MTDDKLLLTLGILLVMGVALHFARMWFYRTGLGGGRAMRISRIVEDDGHLEFDERLAQRLSELERERETKTATSPAPPSAPAPSTPFTPRPAGGFGRRGL